MSKRMKLPISENEFEMAKIKLFASANRELKGFARSLMDYCWNLDNCAVLQQWEGKENRLIVFRVLKEKAKSKKALNYFSIYAVLDSSETLLKCEVIFPSNPEERKRLMEIHDPQRRLHISTINQVEGEFEPGDFDYLAKLVTAARQQRMIG